jgi:parallel beta-helix repeat protein
MRRRIIAIAVILALITGLCLVASTQVTAAGHIWYVDDGGNDVTGNGSLGNPWATIQHAIDDAGVTGDDIIIVADGTYTENITVNKSLTIKSQNGSSVTTVTAANNALDVFNITADNVTIDGFTITGAEDVAGIIIFGNAGDRVTGCTVSNNICSGNAFGILLEYTDDTTVLANTCNNNLWGIYLNYSTSSMVTGNTCMNNNIDTGDIASGIFLDASTGNVISDNRCNLNDNGITIGYDSANNTINNNSCAENRQTLGISGYGICLLDGAANNHIYGNTCGAYHDVETHTDYNGNEKSGICVSYEANNNVIAGNTCNENTESGIILDFWNSGPDYEWNTGNLLMGNTCNENDRGISVYHSHYTVIFNNKLANNTHYGIYLTGGNASGNMAICNTLTHNYDGIYTTIDVTGSGIFIHSNNIASNSNYGIYNQDSETSGDDIDACNNWWGDASGPDDDAGAINGSGDKASTYVNCGEWAQYEKDIPEILTTTATTTSTITSTSTSSTTTVSTATATSTSVTTSTQINIQTQAEVRIITITVTAGGTTTTLLVTTTIIGSATETTTLSQTTMTFTYSSTITSTQSGTTTTTTVIPSSVTSTTTLTLTDETIDWTLTIILTICGLLAGGLIVTILIRKI